MANRNKHNRLVGLVIAVLSLAILGGDALLPTAIQADGNRVGLIVRHGDGSLITRCIEFSEPQISGYDVLVRSGLHLEVSQYSGLGAAICSIDHEGCSPDDCFCQCHGSPCVYWSYWHLIDGTWSYSQGGAGSYYVRDGDVEGWAWTENTSELPQVAFGDICASPPTATATATNTAAPTFTPTATFTPLPTATPTATHTPLPTSTPTDTPQAAAPASTPTATHTPLPTSTPTGTSQAAAPTSTPTATHTPQSTATPTGTPNPDDPTLDFSAQPETITVGGCAQLRWDVENAQVVYLDGQSVNGHQTRKVCPAQTQTYELRVVSAVGEFHHQVTVNVVQLPPTSVFSNAPTPPQAAASAPTDTPEPQLEVPSPPPTLLPTKVPPPSTQPPNHLTTQPPTPSLPAVAMAASPQAPPEEEADVPSKTDQPADISPTKITILNWLLFLAAAVVGVLGFGGMAFVGILVLLGVIYLFARWSQKDGYGYGEADDINGSH